MSPAVIDRGRQATLVRALAVLGVLLVVFAATLEVTHSHRADTKQAGHDCALCSMSHAAIEGAISYQHIPVLGFSAALPTSDESSSSFLTDPCHFIRPPPAV